MEIYDVSSERFRRYGRVINNVDFSDLIEKADNLPCPDEVIYIPGDEELEKSDAYPVLKEAIYGGLPIQIGYCNGHNTYLNALEYHRSSEINVAVTDMVLILGSVEDLQEGYTYDTGKVEAFFVGKGCAVEIYATTLHYAPCDIDNKGFKCVVVLPFGTNYDIDKKDLYKDVCNSKNVSEYRLLAAANKWLIAHEDANIDGAYTGLRGENVCTYGKGL